MGIKLLAVWLILFGAVYAGWISVDHLIVGVLAVIVGVLILLDR